MQNTDDKQWSLKTAITNFFPYDSPYENQKRGIKEALNSFQEGGFYTLEGPCGTGKTLISVVAGITAVRNPNTQYDRILVITPVKQQQQAFEDDLKAINQSIIDAWGHSKKAPPEFKPITSQTIVGKADLCPYVDSESISKQKISSKCSSLMSNTHDAASKQSNGGDILMGARSIIESANSQADQQTLQSNTQEYQNISDAQYSTSPIEYYNDSVCPYYAQHLIDNELGNRTVDYTGSVMTAPDLRQRAAELGTCPYTAMKKSLDDAEVIIGNYAHVFHRGTVEAFTNNYIDESTILIVDEAHMLIERVRDFLSISVSLSDITQAINEIELLQDNYGSLDAEVKDDVDTKLGSYTKADLDVFKSLCKQLADLTSKIVTAYSNKNSLTNGKSGPKSIPLRDPTTVSNDQLDMYLDSIDIDDYFFENSKYIGKAIGQAMNVIANETSIINSRSAYAVEPVGNFVTKKIYSYNSDYFTEINLHPSSSGQSISDNPHIDVPITDYSIYINLHNCFPQQDLSRIFSDFGSGMLMSATLSPMDIYKEIVGINELDCPTKSEQFDLRFPKENRGSWIVPLDRFIYSNRGSPDSNNKTRKDYLNTVLNIIDNAKGNTLVCLPSYTEAEWIEENLQSEISNPIYLDESSSNDETSDLKERFTNENDGVLLTSLRGTLTEGVDFSGDKLSNVIIIGVPLTNPSKNDAKAIETSYALRYTRSNSFEYAFTVPALYKTRQAVGRVIRSTSDVGTRILIDERYKNGTTNSVYSLLTPQEQDEFNVVNKDEIGTEIESFWDRKQVQ